MRHIDNLDDCHDIAARGFKWATIVAHGNRRGEIRSVHVTLEAAKRAARLPGREIAQIYPNGQERAQRAP